MIARDTTLSLKATLADYLNGVRPVYEQVSLKIISHSPLVLADQYSNTITLNILEDDVVEEISSLSKYRYYCVVLKNWKYVIKRVPDENEFYFDILAHNWE
jgi:hypothetical protein